MNKGCLCAAHTRGYHFGACRYGGMPPYPLSFGWRVVGVLMIVLLTLSSCRASREVVADQRHHEQLSLCNFDSLTLYIAPALANAVANRPDAGLAVTTASPALFDSGTSAPATRLIPVAAISRHAITQIDTTMTDSLVHRSESAARPALSAPDPASRWHYAAAAIILLAFCLLCQRR